METKKGIFVCVGNSIGVVVGLAGENGIPEEHLGIWYGQTTQKNVPLYRTVSEEFCMPIQGGEAYH